MNINDDQELDGQGRKSLSKSEVDLAAPFVYTLVPLAPGRLASPIILRNAATWQYLTASNRPMGWMDHCGKTWLPSQSPFWLLLRQVWYVRALNRCAMHIHERT
jgi:hypothetical protein